MQKKTFKAKTVKLDSINETSKEQTSSKGRESEFSQTPP
jgi:hypothetical protein